MSKIYTKIGDDGKTFLIGRQVEKDSVEIDLIGGLDELNSILGLICSHLESNDELSDVRTKLERVQRNMFSIGSILAGARIGFDFQQELVKLESEIDSWTDELPKLSNFILPGGCVAGSIAHLSRAVCRRIERSAVSYFDDRDIQTNMQSIRQHLLSFLNRLSDWLFTVARYINYKQNKSEIIWRNED